MIIAKEITTTLTNSQVKERIFFNIVIVKNNFPSLLKGIVWLIINLIDNITS